MSLRELIIEELKAAKPEGNMSSDDWIEWLYSLSEGIVLKHVDSQEVKERHWDELLNALESRINPGYTLGWFEDRWEIVEENDYANLPSKHNKGTDYDSLFKRLGLKP